MDKPDISRRETFRLARFGILLAAGLGVAKSSSAGQVLKGRLDSVLVKGEVGGILVKLYKVNANGYEFLKTTAVTAKSVKAMGWDLHYTVKFEGANHAQTTISDIMQKY